MIELDALHAATWAAAHKDVAAQLRELSAFLNAVGDELVSDIQCCGAVSYRSDSIVRHAALKMNSLTR